MKTTKILLKQDIAKLSSEWSIFNKEITLEKDLVTGVIKATGRATTKGIILKIVIGIIGIPLLLFHFTLITIASFFAYLIKSYKTLFSYYIVKGDYCPNTGLDYLTLNHVFDFKEDNTK